MINSSESNSLLLDLVSFISAEGKTFSQNEFTIDLREYIKDAKAEGETITRKEALASIKEIEAAGAMKIIKKIDKNRFLVAMVEPSSKQSLLPGFEPSEF